MPDTNQRHLSIRQPSSLKNQTGQAIETESMNFMDDDRHVIVPQSIIYNRVIVKINIWVKEQGVPSDFMGGSTGEISNK